MPRWNRFGSSLLFAAAAAAGLPAAVTFAGPWLGGAGAAKLYVVVAAALYGVGVVEGAGLRRRALALAGLGSTVIALLPLGLAHSAGLAAILVAVCRSGLQTSAQPLRALVLELLLGSAGLAAAAFLSSGGLRGLALAVWGYFLIQSAYFLIRARPGRAGTEASDPFERARVRLERLWLDSAGPERP